MTSLRVYRDWSGTLGRYTWCWECWECMKHTRLGFTTWSESYHDALWHAWCKHPRILP